MLGVRAKVLADVGVAGIHRLLNNLPEGARRPRPLCVVAGMEGALASVVGGLVAQPVVAVPTSVGYGAAFAGLSALLGMLTSALLLPISTTALALPALPAASSMPARAATTLIVLPDKISHPHVKAWSAPPAQNLVILNAAYFVCCARRCGLHWCCNGAQCSLFAVITPYSKRSSYGREKYIIGRSRRRLLQAAGAGWRAARSAIWSGQTAPVAQL